MSYLVRREAVVTNTSAQDARVGVSRSLAGLGQAVLAGLGLFLSVVGILAVYRARLDGSLNVPVVRASWFNLSAMVGLAVLALGLVLVLGAASFALRNVGAVVGVIMVVGGVILGAGGRAILRDVGAPQATGWAIMAGGVVALAAWSCIAMFDADRLDRDVQPTRVVEL